MDLRQLLWSLAQLLALLHHLSRALSTPGTLDPVSIAKTQAAVLVMPCQRMDCELNCPLYLDLSAFPLHSRYHLLFTSSRICTHGPAVIIQPFLGPDETQAASLTTTMQNKHGPQGNFSGH
ncbi:hypothetical protein K435DRAFT_795467 [Dendrothele bispora CBS 962.96]|uniref:C2H2-type domain-containing protein n=1 Tax=Dendrothele bispora (strain CBS 962.96) TaxID=1314807 RepID=A0A4S8M8N1_DENBC|nr:hypothetical protein K435DRAFT_795467 [Dendrothele bispora CBS 962.96]